MLLSKVLKSSIDWVKRYDVHTNYVDGTRDTRSFFPKQFCTFVNNLESVDIIIVGPCHWSHTYNIYEKKNSDLY